MSKIAISTNLAPSAIGPYSQAIQADGGAINVSGQIPIDPITGVFAGESIEEQTAQCLKNIAAILAEAGTSMADVVETTVMLTDMEEFAAMNEVYADFFSEPFPARAAFQVAALPKGAKIEIKCVARV